MATWFDDSAGGVLDGLLDKISSQAIRVLLISNYSQGDNYATVVGNSLGEATISPADFSGPAPGASNSRVLTFSGKSGTASATDPAPTNLHIALTNNVDKVLAVTDETSDQAITSGKVLAPLAA
jgi:hypothetical protein